MASDEKASVREVAARVGLSEYYFIRAFRALYGETPHRYRTRARLERAKGLLLAGESVTQACLRVGFSSVGSFSALFGRWAGAPPSSYRGGAAQPPGPGPSVPGCLGAMTGLPRGAWSNSREAPAE